MAPTAVQGEPVEEPVVVAVCVSCRPAGAPAGLPGAELLARLREEAGCLGPGVEIRPVQCLSVCKRPCTIALSSPGRYTYVFGDIDPAGGAAEIVACLEVYRQQEHGYMLWRERPESLRRGIVARIPPITWDTEDGSHPR
ncbi:MAG: metal-binding protein [Enterovirga sp.]|jgi:predicted metal-binding protein|nr:metal-binding protein [Enterovirga sp.]